MHCFKKFKTFSQPSHLLRLVLWQRLWCVLVNSSHALQGGYSSVVGCSSKTLSQVGCQCGTSFHLLVLSVTEGGMLQSPTIFVDLSISPISPISFCSMYFEALLLSIHLSINLSTYLSSIYQSIHLSIYLSTSIIGVCCPSVKGFHYPWYVHGEFFFQDFILEIKSDSIF